MSGPTRADFKAALAEVGATMDPNAEFSLLDPPTGPQTVVILERVRKDYTPPYCCHGYANCVSCYAICYLGHSTSKVVGRGEATPVCEHCAAEAQKQGLMPESPVARIRDRLREEGPHDD